MGYTIEQVKKFQENTLGLDDIFKFSCKQCGNCCRKRDEAILITGVDIFYIAKELGITPTQVIEKYTDYHIGSDSRVPVFTLRERLDGSCSLLRKGKCTVHKNKPVPCALYPLGRMIIGDANEYTYFYQEQICGLGKNGEEHTVREWLDEFNLRARDKEGIAWMRLFSEMSKRIREAEKRYEKNKNEKNDELLKKSLFDSVQYLYIGYDTSKDMYEQVKSYLEVVQVSENT